MADPHDCAHTGIGFVIEQMVTVVVCGALGATAVLMYARGLLQFILAPQFFTPVLCGGVALLALALIRSVTLWKTRGACETGGHDHDRGWMPLRCELLAVPVVLYCFNLPNPSFGAMTGVYLNGTRHVALENVGYLPSAKTGGPVMELSFHEWSAAALRRDRREYLQGRLARITGFLQPVSDREFTLVRLQMTCCASDAVPLRARIITADSIVGRPGLQRGAWVEVVGVIQFRRVAGQDAFIPVLQVDDLTRIRVADPVGNEYEVG
jgi:hypothetical protein